MPWTNFPKKLGRTRRRDTDPVGSLIKKKTLIRLAHILRGDVCLVFIPRSDLHEPCTDLCHTGHAAAQRRSVEPACPPKLPPHGATCSSGGSPPTACPPPDRHLAFHRSRAPAPGTPILRSTPPTKCILGHGTHRWIKLSTRTHSSRIPSNPLSKHERRLARREG